ncbi:DNA internalization-related competence protein ComEC/Rec2 [Erwinia sp. OLTSP20]|uniref:DNA internalization-related competence protein ComEC/Rec2 n=1 Tax=unclassified Erwinia TaxID=2622719 RepID=UPI000C18B973|nr:MULTISPECIES: DNA internalization-related competence protein ComEC/Rec2 [unclassified Erwinia]PIJ51322.1 DNA internalization-related competence protein ComEC/Rec2 [Erwinia sp. OAMSP11]PIJ74107.1 DNA internalization-related competence protein ComEC/Rec2 [Erwinia sp. OLSSP12]PIJ79796.1 DNA internalization-related competence protein ComEC/Rec2 [Erwinia sp. OLCASP19]PIJ86070.1 DNA internalization-related competence protein ComEC/Rec2 [Erwinia sp. OLMTSP26]PIJ87819.1 DNA internalization-related 
MVVNLTQLALITVLATLPLAFLPALPATSILGLTACCGVLLLRLPWRGMWYGGLLLLLFSWSAWQGQRLLTQMNNLSCGNVEAQVTVTEVQPDKHRIQIRLDRINHQPQFPPLRAIIYPRGSQMTQFCSGQRWQMTLTLRPVHGWLNEGGFDSQRYRLANGNPLQGRIISAGALQRHCGYRARLIRLAQQHTQNRHWGGILNALTFGDRSGIDRATNQLLRETGIMHLIAISGLHISFAAAAGWLLGRRLQFFLPTARIDFKMPLLVGMSVAMAYCWLAGTNPPVMRAILALLSWNLLRLAGWHCRSVQVWLLCLALLLFTDPISILSDSLILSIVAVGGILLWYRLAPLPGWIPRKWYWGWLHLLHLQLGILLLMLPVQAMMFHGFSLSALFANLWAVPVVSMVSVPLSLLAVCCSPCYLLAACFWWLADQSLMIVFWPLQRLPSGWFTLSETQCWLSSGIWLVLAAWRFALWRGHLASLLALMMAVWLWRMYPPQPQWRVDMLDVGHGLALVISRGQRAVIYDTGKRWPGGDMGRSVIIPWMQWHHLRPDQIILSHGDLDHIGGLASLLAHWPQTAVRSHFGPADRLPCERGNHWRWHGLTFSVLWPLKEDKGKDNNHSCVIRISDGRWRVLLTGDLESRAEYRILGLDRTALRATVLQVGHHGSRSSSSWPWLRSIAGQAALASTSRYNPWRLPASVIIKRFRDNHYHWWDTAKSGQISVKFYRNRWAIDGFREQIMPRWYHQWFGVPRDSR